jgi:hypothetical protein
MYIVDRTWKSKQKGMVLMLKLLNMAAEVSVLGGMAVMFVGYSLIVYPYEKLTQRSVSI